MSMPKSPVLRNQGTVFITGGSSGIGRCTALAFARQGWRVGLIARGAAGLAATAALLMAEGAEAATAQADASDAAALREAANSLVMRLGIPDVWINCAGNGVYGRFASVPEVEFERVTSVTYHGTVNGCRTALALMQPAGAGAIVNVCSAVAFHGLPLMTSYAGAKAAVRCFSQALRAELRIARSPIRLACVFPPAVNTPFFAHAPSHMGWPARPAPPVYQPEIIAQGILLAARTGRAEMTITGTATLFALAQRLAPWAIAWAMTRLGFDGQLTQDAAAALKAEPTLFEPSEGPAESHGAFGAHSRRHSVLLALRAWWAGVQPAGGKASLRRLPAPSAGRGLNEAVKVSSPPG